VVWGGGEGEREGAKIMIHRRKKYALTIKTMCLYKQPESTVYNIMRKCDKVSC
jgi:hypothetical protein